MRTIYPEGEANQIADRIMENLTGSKKTERMLFKNEVISPKEEQQLQEYIKRLLAHEPVQYVLNEAWFCGLRFYVDRHVLIPRPETEELVEWIIDGCKFPIDHLSILDVGTGSGCIAVSLKRRLGKAIVTACDIEENALAVARKNADKLGAEVHFIAIDFLNTGQTTTLPAFDIIVSNPPYVTMKEKEQMQANVLDHEPHTALFVPDEDPLTFYRALALFGKDHLEPNGFIYAEINEQLADKTSSLMRDLGYTTEIKKDLQGKDRMIRARR